MTSIAGASRHPANHSMNAGMTRSPGRRKLENRSTSLRRYMSLSPSDTGRLLRRRESQRLGRRILCRLVYSLLCSSNFPFPLTDRASIRHGLIYVNVILDAAGAVAFTAFSWFLLFILRHADRHDVDALVMAEIIV